MDAELHRAHADLDETHWWFVARRSIIAAVLRRHVDRADTVVDVGCGAGGLLGMLGDFGRVVAIEGDQENAAEAQRRHPEAEVRVGLLPEVADTLPSADLLTAFDVIEHLDDDVEALRRLRERIAPGGTLCVTVPALPWLWSAHDDLNQHRRRYTAKTLRSSLETAGFQVTLLSYFNCFLLPMVTLARLVERLRGPDRSTGGDFDRSLGPVDRVLGAIFRSEQHVLIRWSFPVGVSLIAVARPR